MQGEPRRGKPRARLARSVSQSAKLLAALMAPLVLGCAGAMPVPVFLPGERVDCLFEVIGDLTVEGPFRAADGVEGGAREAILEGVRLEVGQQAAESGADAVMVRELVYERDAATAEASSPEIIAVEGMLVSFVDPVCVPAG